MQDFRNLDAWVKAHRLVLAVYSATRALPREEIFGITMQLRRAATAVPMRIAEACGGDAQDMARELRRAAAMTSDLEYLVLLASDFGTIRQTSARKINERGRRSSEDDLRFDQKPLTLIVQCGDAGENFAFEELEARSAAGGDVGDLVGDAGGVDRCDRITAADDRDAVLILGDGARDGVGALGEWSELGDAHGAVPDDGGGVGDLGGEE